MSPVTKGAGIPTLWCGPSSRNKRFHQLPENWSLLASGLEQFDISSLPQLKQMAPTFSNF